jgi:hypothetical protein
MFTTAEKVDIRRFCGYGLYGTGTPTPASGYRFSVQYGVLEYKMNTLGAEEEAVVRTTYLANLATLENAIVGTSANLDTEQAAVWTHNKNELKDRKALLNEWRRNLCGFLGISAGEGLSNSGIQIVV